MLVLATFVPTAESHPRAASRKAGFPPVADPRARLLVLGSLPGDRSLAERRYYAHPQNQFWRLMGPVVGRDLAVLPYAARLAALQDAGVALWDVIAHANRPGSSDSAILDAKTNDLTAFIATLPHLQAIALNGATAHRHALTALGKLTARFEIVLLPSSSPLHTIGIAGKQASWSALRQWLAFPLDRHDPTHDGPAADRKST